MDSEAHVRMAKLGTKNWHAWSFQMKSLLSLKGCLHAIQPPAAASSAPAAKSKSAEGSKAEVKQESTPPPSPPLTELSEADDRKAMALISLHVEEHHYLSLAQCKTARECWSALEQQYLTQARVQLVELRRALTTVTQIGGEGMTAYFARAQQLWHDLQAAGGSMTESDVVQAVLAGLRSDFSMAVVMLQMSGAALTFAAVQPPMLAVEQKQRVDQGRYGKSVQAAAMMAMGGQGGRGRGGRGSGPACWTCGQPGHVKRNCPTPCGYCGKLGHGKEDCGQRTADLKKNVIRDRVPEHERAASKVAPAYVNFGL